MRVGLPGGVRTGDHERDRRRCPETCRLACENACTMPDASGKFSAVVYGTQLEGDDKGSAPKDDKKRLGVERGS